MEITEEELNDILEVLNMTLEELVSLTSSMTGYLLKRIAELEE